MVKAPGAGVHVGRHGMPVLGNVWVPEANECLVAVDTDGVDHSFLLEVGGLADLRGEAPDGLVRRRAELERQDDAGADGEVGESRDDGGGRSHCDGWGVAWA